MNVVEFFTLILSMFMFVFFLANSYTSNIREFMCMSCITVTAFVPFSSSSFFCDYNNCLPLNTIILAVVVWHSDDMCFASSPPLRVIVK